MRATSVISADMPAAWTRRARRTIAARFAGAGRFTSVAANTPVTFVSNADVGSRSAYLVSFVGKVNGVTTWTAGSMTKVEILDTAGNNLFVGITLANLTGNANFAPGMSNVGHGDAYRLRTGTPAGIGMHLVADGTATAGSTLQFTALIKIE